jgi:HSP20 family molecular chaperone IbpA
LPRRIEIKSSSNRTGARSHVARTNQQHERRHDAGAIGVHTRTEIYETKDDVVLVAEMPESTGTSVEVTLEDDVLDVGRTRDLDLEAIAAYAEFERRLQEVVRTHGRRRRGEDRSLREERHPPRVPSAARQPEDPGGRAKA